MSSIRSLGINKTVSEIIPHLRNSKNWRTIKPAVDALYNKRKLFNTEARARVFSIANSSQYPMTFWKPKLIAHRYFSTDILTQSTSEKVLHPKLDPYKNLCTEYYCLDKPNPPTEELTWFLKLLKNSKNVLEPMSGSGRFLIPLMQAGVKIVGFDNSNSMISACKRQCERLGICPDFFSLDSFKTFSPKKRFSDVVIPSGSFCLITDDLEIKEVLMLIHEWLIPNGRFIFDLETIYSLPDIEGVPSISWVEKPDNSLIVLSSASRFDKSSKVQTSLNKYELWKEGNITKIELEEFRIRLYSKKDIISLLSDAGFKCDSVTTPYTDNLAKEEEGYIQLVCHKVQ